MQCLVRKNASLFNYFFSAGDQRGPSLFQDYTLLIWCYGWRAMTLYQLSHQGSTKLPMRYISGEKRIEKELRKIAILYISNGGNIHINSMKDNMGLPSQARQYEWTWWGCGIGFVTQKSIIHSYPCGPLLGIMKDDNSDRWQAGCS